MKEFAIYTVMRIVLFAATFGVVVGLWVLIAGDANVFFAVIISFVLSGIGSYYVLERQRAAFARRVEARAERAAAAFEEMRSKEDAD
ncbi:DUF4229 domain-containing protein [Nocardioides sp.]|uniref:DUF4229 domain-containing protein n=1 Tax=Nocardioides sp. TaxID=35761 RepID=UPI00356448C5